MLVLLAKAPLSRESVIVPVPVFTTAPAPLNFPRLLVVPQLANISVLSAPICASLLILEPVMVSLLAPALTVVPHPVMAPA